ncbi:unnamed protein product, partial [Mesorhabditis belari]|uniref:Thioredoxin domain-containing protein n=1 Tax=Mesorhabditis belari TaxID=2138241 RepID=A0AAF3FND6_9BILA
MYRVYQIIVVLLYGSYVFAKNSSCTLNRGGRLKAYLLKYCPVTEEEECVDDTLDNLSAIRYRCFNFEASTNNSNMTVHLLHATEMMALLRLKETEAKRKSSCILSLFYAPECQFSARLAPYFNALPYRFPRLTVVAIDATDFSKFNSRYGITGTPTVILWVNGMAVARMDDRPLNSKGLDGFIKHWTDLEPRALPSEPITPGPLLLEVDPSVNFKYVVLSWIILFSGSAYYYFNSAFGQRLNNNLQRGHFTPTITKNFLCSVKESNQNNIVCFRILPNDAMTNRESTLPYERMVDPEEPQPSEEISPAELPHNNWGNNSQIQEQKRPLQLGAIHVGTEERRRLAVKRMRRVSMMGMVS